MIKSVLFFAGAWGIGGVEKVTSTIASKMAQDGWHVCIVACRIDERGFLLNLPESVQVFELGFPVLSISNLEKLKKIICSNKVSYIINQWALPISVIILLRTVAVATKAKIVSVQHNAPNLNNHILKAKTRLGKWFWRMVTRLNLKVVYLWSSAYVVLSEGVRPVLMSFIGINQSTKIVTIPNPVDLERTESFGKENVLLYVGRLSLPEKCPDRIIEVWRNLYKELPDWRMDIVGDGPDRQSIEMMSKGMPRIRFHGFQRPEPFYARSKIFLIASAYEGFSITNIEAMSMGCVPVVLGTFPSAYDTLGREGDCGVIVPPPWNLDKYAMAILKIARQPAVIEKMAMCGRMRAERYTIASVVKQYERLLSDL